MPNTPRDTIQDEKIQSFIDETLSPDEIVDKRIFLVRHGECEDEVKAEYDVKKQKDPNSQLTPKGIEQIEKTASYLINILQDTTNTLAIEHNANNSIRIKQSSGIIQDKVDYASIWDDKGLDSLPLYSENDQMGAKSKGADIQYEYYKSLQERLKNKYKEDIKYVLLMLHKSSIAFLEHDFVDTKMDFNITYNYKHGEIREWDYTREGKFINKEERKDILQINKGNRDEIIGILETDEVITQSGKISIRSMDIIQLQNFVNAYFKKNEKMYEKYLGSENVDLRVFCLTNLITILGEKHPYANLLNPKYNLSKEEAKTILQEINTALISKYEPIYKTLINSKYKLSQEEKNILLTNQTKNILLKKLVIELFVTKKKLRDTEEGELFSSFKLSNFYEELKKRRVIYEKAVGIQQRSLDKTIIEQKENSILKRKIYTVEEIKTHTVEKKKIYTVGEIEKNNYSKKNESENKLKNKMEYKKTDINIQEIIIGLKSFNDYVLPAHVGSGKSIWLSDIVKQIILDPDVDVHFYEGKDFDNMDIATLNMFPNRLEIDSGSELIHKNKQILCIDGIDEINNPRAKEIIKNHMSNMGMGSIVTSRLSEYNDKDNEGYITLGMENISKEEFIKKKIADPKKIAIVLDKLEQSDLSEEIEGNPLLLNFVCMLANEHNTFHNIGIESIENITNRSNLYENIVKLILYKHEGEKSQYYIGNGGKIRLYNDMQLLGKFAYILYTGGDIKDFEKDSILRDEDNFKRFSILFKKTEDNAYGFIHKSFEEFFAVQEILKILGNKEGKEAEEYLTSIISQRKIEYGILKFLVDSININNNNYLKKAILESLNHEDHEVRSNIIRELGRVGGKNNIEFIKSFKDDQYGSVRISIIRALGKKGGEENIEFIKSFKDDKADSVRKEMIETLRIIGGKKNIEFMKSFKNDPSPNMRNNIILALGNLEFPTEHIEFIKSFKDEIFPFIRKNTIEIIGGIGGKEDIEFIKSFKDDPCPSVRQAMIQSLGGIGGKENIEFIKLCKNDEDIHVRNEIMSILKRIGGEENLAFIKSMKEGTP